MRGQPHTSPQLSAQRVQKAHNQATALQANRQPPPPSATPQMMFKKMMFSSNNKSYNYLNPRTQSNFFSSGLAAGDEPSASSNSSGDCANFHPQARQHPQNDSGEALKRYQRYISNDVNEFDNVHFSPSQFKDFADAGDDEVVADDMEQLFCSDLFTEDVAAAAAATRAAISAEPSTDTAELMSPAERKNSEEGSSMASSLPSQGSAGVQGHHSGVAVSMNYASSAEVTAGSSPVSAFVNADVSKSPFKGSLMPNAPFPEVHNHPPQGYGGVNSKQINASVPSTIAVPQATPQVAFESMTDPTAAAVAASAHFFQTNNNLNDASLQFCYTTLAKETQFSTGVAANICPQPSKHTCAKCHYPGSDIKIKNCPNGCTYHARCLDLISLCNQKSNVNNTHHVHNNEGMMGPTSLSRGATPPTSMPLFNNGNMTGGCESQGMLTHCPCCFSTGATGIEILPLDFDELDLVQRKVTEENEAKLRR